MAGIRDSRGRFIGGSSSGALKVREKDNGYRQLANTARRAARARTIAVGVLAANATAQAEGADTGITVADVATWNEFGLGVPERSFLRAWYDEARPKLKALHAQLWKSVIKGTRTADQVYETIGLWAVAEIQKRIVGHIPPPNAPATVAAKGSSTPLVDSGQLKSSISFEVRP